MTEDFIESTFGDLDVYYPGSKRKRKSVTQKPKEPRPTISGEWDSQPLVKEINGKSVELFTVGAIAKALNRSFILVRYWNNEGFLPDAPYRMPSKKDKYGTMRKGNRLYSRAMVEYLVTVFNSSGLMEAKRIDWKNYRNLTNQIDTAWNDIRANETN
jgi:hypothetical protein